jgi:hypothetical protein
LQGNDASDQEVSTADRRREPNGEQYFAANGIATLGGPGIE